MGTEEFKFELFGSKRKSVRRKLEETSNDECLVITFKHGGCGRSVILLFFVGMIGLQI